MYLNELSFLLHFCIKLPYSTFILIYLVPAIDDDDS